MNKSKIFRVTWETGYIKVYINGFFTKAKMRAGYGLLKLASQYCTSTQQNALLLDLEELKSEQSGEYRERIEKYIKRIKTQKWGTGK